MIGGGRQAHRNLALVLLAKLPPILPGHADRVRALLRDTGVVDNQRADRATLFDNGHDLGTYCLQHRVIGPIGLGHDVMQ